MIDVVRFFVSYFKKYVVFETLQCYSNAHSFKFIAKLFSLKVWTSNTLG